MPAGLVLRVVAAVAVLAACFGVGSTAAHAADQTASATLVCQPIPGSSYQTATWHVHLENNHDRCPGDDDNDGHADNNDDHRRTDDTFALFCVRRNRAIEH